MQSPDENQHIARAYSLTQGEWVLKAPAGKMSGGMLDAGLEEYIRQYMLLAGKPDFRLSETEINRLGQLAWQGEKTQRFFEMPGTGYYLPFVYLPHALGLKASQMMGLRIHASYHFTRFVVIGSTAALIICAFLMLPQGTGILSILLLPMTVFQLILPTLDGFTTALAMVIVALFARLSQSLETPDRTWWLQWMMALSLLLVVTSRVHLLPMAMLPFVLSWHRRQLGYAAWGLVVLACTAAWLAFAVTSTVDTRIPRDHTSTEILRFYVTAPWDFFVVLANTWTNPDLTHFYWRSFIGILGWLDASLAAGFYPWIGIGLGLGMIGCISIPRKGDDFLFRISLLVMAAVSFALIFLALLVTWTPHPANLIAGVQGRYFVVPALLLCYSLQGFSKPKWRFMDLIHKFGSIQFYDYISIIRPLFIASFGILCLAALASGLIVRYGS